MSRTNKTVFILGAGFAKPAKSLLQNEIIGEILKINPIAFSPHEIKVSKYIVDFKDFLSKGLYISASQFHKVPLEDVLTPIDRCIIDGISFRSYDRKKLFDLRETIYSLIILAIKSTLDHSNNKNYIDKFANFLVTQMQPRNLNNKDHDPVAVLSTNWDILLDRSIKSAVHADNDNGVVDYCCYISSLEKDDTIIPGLLALGLGKYNVKLLKLHGSMNWLHCPKCQRLYVAFEKKIAESGIYGDQFCPHCTINFKKDDSKSNSLRHNLIMPTFLKDLDNIQIKLIWQNAGIELSEASKIVFIGYSLPNADFELRQLLSRMIRPDAEIEVVMQKETKTSLKIKRSNDETLKRYKTFFGNRKITSYREGVVKYVELL
jgi:hypothetical protein